MKIEGTYSFDAPKEEVWAALIDPDVLVKAIPGGQELEETGENQYRAKMKIRIGPVQGIFSGKVQLSDVVPPHSYHISVDGKGAPGFVKGTGTLRLKTQDSKTILQYEGDAQIGGRLANLGQRLMESSSQALIRQGLEALDAQIAARLNPDESGEPAPLPAPPSELQFAAGVTMKMVEDMFPPERRQDLIRAGLVSLAALLVLRSVAKWWANLLARRIAEEIAKQ